MSSRNHYEKIEDEDYIIIDIDEFFKNFEEIQNTNGDKIFRNRETNEEFILIKYVKKKLEKENKHVKEFITSTIKKDIIDNPEYLSTYVINEPIYIDKSKSPKDDQEQYSSQRYVPVTENFSLQGNLSQKNIQNVVSTRGIPLDQSPQSQSVVSTQGIRPDKSPQSQNVVSTQGNPLDQSPQSQSFVSTQGIQNIQSPQSQSFVSTQGIQNRQMHVSQQRYPQNPIYTFGQMPVSQQTYRQYPTYNTYMQRHSLQPKKKIYVNLDNTVDTPDNDIPSKYSSRETRTLEYGEPIRINPIRGPLHPSRELKKQRTNEILSNMRMNNKISNYNPIQLPQQHNISRSTLKNTPVDTRIIDQRVAVYERSKIQPIFTEKYINTDDTTISNNYHNQQIPRSPQINSQSGYPISQQLIDQPIEDASLMMPLPLSGTISIPTIKTLTDHKDINCALFGNQLNREMQNLGRPPIPGINKPSPDMLKELNKLKGSCVVSGGNIRIKSKRFFYKLLNNPKTTYIKYKEHLYIKFKNYLLSVKKLQDYIYSKDYSKK